MDALESENEELWDETRWVARLGAGLILCCFQRYEEALKLLIWCHQICLRFQSEEASYQCRVDVAESAIMDALSGFKEISKALRVMETCFLEHNNTLQSAAAWSKFFLGLLLSFGSREQRQRAVVPLEEACLEIAGDSSNNHRCYVECKVYERLSRTIVQLDTRLDYVKKWKEAAARWGKLDQEVYALYYYGKLCLNNPELLDKAIWVSVELHSHELVGYEHDDEFVGHSGNNALFQALHECFCGHLVCTFNDIDKTIAYVTKVIRRLELLPSAASKNSWSSYFAYCASPTSTSILFPSPLKSPNRDYWFSVWLRDALSLILSVIAHYRLPGNQLFAVGLLAIGKCKQLVKCSSDVLFGDMTMTYLDTVRGIYDKLLQQEGGKWYDLTESVLAKILQASANREEHWDTYIATLLRIVLLNNKFGDRFYLEYVDHELHFKMINSLFVEAERLLRLHQHQALLPEAVFEQAKFLFRFGKMDQVIEKLESMGRIILERSNILKSFSSYRIPYNDRWKSRCSFEMLQAALISCGLREQALLWAERERAQDLLHLVSKNHTIASAVEYELNLDDETAYEEITSITCDAGEDTVFLVYTTVAGEQGICGYLLHENRTQAQFTKFLTPRNIEGQIRQTVKCFEEKITDWAGLQDWYKLLILPFEASLETIKPRKLIIVPREELVGLPFAALFKGPGEPFLIEKYAISYIPSLRMFSHCKCVGQALMKSNRRESSLVIGNPATKLARLHYAQEEAFETKKILEKVGFKTVEFLHGNGATKSAILNNLPTAEWIHYAGHAAVTDKYPRGALHVAPEAVASPSSSTNEETRAPTDLDCLPENDCGVSKGMRLIRELEKSPGSEVLTADDIQSSGIVLRALVTVLSACQSGLGEVLSEGVLGLCRSLHVVGAPSVMCSLWSVDDMSTKSFMSMLYERLVAGSELAIAYQEVVMTLLEEEDEGCDVFKWASFFISGNPAIKLISDSAV